MFNEDNKRNKINEVNEINEVNMSGQVPMNIDNEILRANELGSLRYRYVRVIKGRSAEQEVACRSQTMFKT
jgi:hypothetical protein